MIHLQDYPPPAIYDHSFKGTKVTIIYPLEKVNLVCHHLGVNAKEGQEIYGCSQKWLTGGCLIIIPKVDNTISQADQNMVNEVENANCNGWPRGSRI